MTEEERRIEAIRQRLLQDHLCSADVGWLLCCVVARGKQIAALKEALAEIVPWIRKRVAELGDQ